MPFRRQIPYRYTPWGKWLWDRICVGYLFGLDSGMLSDWSTLAEVESIKTVKLRVLLYNRKFEWFLGAYSFTNTHMMVVVVRPSICGVHVWTWLARMWQLANSLFWRRWKWIPVVIACPASLTSDTRKDKPRYTVLYIMCYSYIQTHTRTERGEFGGEF